MLLRLDPKHYCEEIAAIVLTSGKPYFVQQSASGTGAVVDNVTPADLEEVEAEIARLYPAVERGGNPNHDCTGQWFRYSPRVTVSEPDYDETVYVTVEPGSWVQDI